MAGAWPGAAIFFFTEDLDGLLAHVRLPARHRIHCRTTNLIERSFEGERRRTKVIPRFTDERSAMKLVFAALIRCSERWSRVSITDIERHQLRLLRAELGMDSEEFRNLDPVGGGSPPLACALLYRKELHAALACLLPRSPHPRTQRLVLDRTERAIAVAALRAKYPRYPECARRPRVHRTDILGGLIHEYEPVAA